MLNAEEVQILIGQFLHISGQVMRRHYRDNEGIDIRCRVRQIVNYVFTRRLDMPATVEVTDTVTAANMGDRQVATEAHTLQQRRWKDLHRRHS